MTPEQIRIFREQGCLHISTALGKELVRPVATHVLNELKRQKFWSSGRALSQKLQGVPVFQQVGKLGQAIQYPGLRERVIPQSLYSDLCQLAGVKLAPPSEAQLLISLPHHAEWTLAGLNWHRDISESQLGLIPGVQAFILLDDLAVKGGATLALAGSHRLKSYAQAKQGISRLVAEGGERRVTVGDVELSVVEMAGRAGDVYLMDMRLLHTPSINVTKNVRIMATARCFTV